MYLNVYYIFERELYGDLCELETKPSVFSCGHLTFMYFLVKFFWNVVLLKRELERLTCS